MLLNVNVTQAAALSLLVKEYWSKWRTTASFAPGYAFRVPHVLATPLRTTLPVCVASVFVMLPDPVRVHVGILKFTVKVPSLLLTVRVKLIGVPHAKAVDKLTWKGVIFVPLPLTAMFGYPELGWVTVTPGVDEERVADTPVIGPQPGLLIVISSVSHSFRSRIPFPLPPETVAETKAACGDPLTHWSRNVVVVLSIVT